MPTLSAGIIFPHPPDLPSFKPFSASSIVMRQSQSRQARHAVQLAIWDPWLFHRTAWKVQREQTSEFKCWVQGREKIQSRLAKSICSRTSWGTELSWGWGEPRMTFNGRATSSRDSTQQERDRWYLVTHSVRAHFGYVPYFASRTFWLCFDGKQSMLYTMGTTVQRNQKRPLRLVKTECISLMEPSIPSTPK